MSDDEVMRAVRTLREWLQAPSSDMRRLRRWFALERELTGALTKSGE